MKPLSDMLVALPLCVGLGWAVVEDVRWRRIRNPITAGLTLGGLAVWTVYGGAWGLAQSAAAAAILLALGLWPMARGWIGGGDVKLISAVGAWVGVAAVPRLVLLIAASGGLVSLATLLWMKRATWIPPARLRGDLPAQGPALRLSAWNPRVPFGVAIAAGALLTLLGQRP